MIRAKIPKGRGLWPAFWLLPQDDRYGGWANSGEVDILEIRGQEPGEIEGTLHYSSGWPYNRYRGSGPVPIPYVGGDLSTGFHDYMVEWDPDRIRWYVDGYEFVNQDLQYNWHEQDTTEMDDRAWGARPTNPYTANRQPWDQPFHIILNLAIGGNFLEGPTEADVKNWTDSRYIIDRVAVYQRLGGYYDWPFLPPFE